MFNKIDLNCYVFLTLSNDKLLLIIYFFCAFFPFISNTSMVINVRANLDAQNKKYRSPTHGEILKKALSRPFVYVVASQFTTLENSHAWLRLF
jgi:hypothetical protein